MIFLHNPQKGITIFEVLVALLITTIGIFSAISLSIKTIKMNQQSQYYLKAVLIANSMIERIQVNELFAKTMDAYQTSFDHMILSCPKISKNNLCDKNQCNSFRIAQNDIQYFKQEIACHLPEGRGEITFQQKNYGRLYRVTIKYFDKIVLDKRQVSITGFI